MLAGNCVSGKLLAGNCVSGKVLAGNCVGGKPNWRETVLAAKICRLKAVLTRNCWRETYLVENEGPGVGREPTSVEVVHPGVDVLHVAGPHVLAGIHTETSHSDRDQVVEVVGNLLTNIVGAERQIHEANETAVADLGGEGLEFSQNMRERFFQYLKREISESGCTDRDHVVEAMTTCVSATDPCCLETGPYLVNVIVAVDAAVA